MSGSNVGSGASIGFVGSVGSIGSNTSSAVWVSRSPWLTVMMVDELDVSERLISHGPLFDDMTDETVSVPRLLLCDIAGLCDLLPEYRVEEREGYPES